MAAGPRLALLAMAALFACAAPADAERPPYGALKRLPGRDGCTGVFFGSCRAGTLGGDRIVLSPDERFAYAASKEGTVAGYSRNPESGALRSISGVGGCVVGRATFNEVAAASVCIEWDLLGPMPDVLGIAVSPDGRHVYFGSGGLTFVPPTIRHARELSRSWKGTFAPGRSARTVASPRPWTGAQSHRAWGP